MAHIPLNKPCPCGSGKKYKHCCRAADEDRRREQRSRHLAVARALVWLDRFHAEAVGQAIEDQFFGPLDDGERARFDGLPSDLQQMAMINAQDWLLAEGQIEVEGEMRRVSELLLGPGGPLLEASQREWLSRMVETPVGLWEVQECRPGLGLWVRDAFDRQAPRLWVVEHSGSRSLRAWDVLGARVLPWEDHGEISGGVYPFPREGMRPLIEGLERALKKTARRLETEQLPWLRGRLISAAWLRSITQEPSLPQFVDRGSGDPILLTNDHYEVRDWGRLAAALQAQPDVEGDRREGWTRFVELGGEMRRSLLAINPKGERHIEAFARTRRLAEEGRAWLERVAGDSIAFRSREIVDPLSALQVEARAGGARGGRPAAPEIPKTTELAQQIYEQIYRNWADEPIPMLGGKTPRKAARSEAGRERLVELLKSYENHEARQARDEGRKPASFGFLWEAVGLDRDAALR